MKICCPLRAAIVLLLGAIAPLSHVIAASAQIVPDGSLPQNSIVSPSSNGFQIDGGTAAGANLFHSFSEFSIPAGAEAFFNNAASVDNILTRVTGDRISNIDGLIRASGTANLFFLNPNGIAFGPNARLDIGGSFFATTADGIAFGDGSNFSAANPEPTALLSVNVPVGLQFGSAGDRPSGSITATGPGGGVRNFDPTFFAPLLRGDSNLGLRVPSGETIALVGNGLALQGATLVADSGNVFLGSLETGTATLAQAATGWAIDIDADSGFRDIDLTRAATLDASGTGGAIRLQGRNITLAGGSLALATHDTPEPGSEIEVMASESLVLTGTDPDVTLRSGLATFTLGDGRGGDITIATERLQLDGGGVAIAQTFGSGRGGDATVRATESVDVIGVATLNSFAFSIIGTNSFGMGRAGDITVQTGRLRAIDGGTVSSAAIAAGDGGNLTAIASESIEAIGFNPEVDLTGAIPLDPMTFSAISAIATISLGPGRAGDVTVRTERLRVADGAAVASVPFALGNGGNVTAIASESIEVVGFSPGFASTNSVLVAPTAGAGDSGNLFLETRNLRILDGGQIGSGAVASGNAGNVTAIASESIEVRGTIAATGDPSSIQSDAPANDPFQLLFGLPPIPSSDAGSITLIAPTLIVADGGTIAVANQGTGVAGNINLAIDRLVLLDTDAKVNASTTSGEGGNINVATDALQLRRTSQLTAEAGGTGNGGNVTINADTIALLEDSEITANAFEGDGGNIAIATQGMFASPESSITASSQFGIDGIVEITNPEIDTDAGLADLSDEVPDPEDRVSTACSVDEGSSFTHTGRGGLPDDPAQPLLDRELWRDWQNYPPSNNSTIIAKPIPRVEDTPPSQEIDSPPIEATAWKLNADGTVALLAEGARSPTLENFASCQ